MIQTDFVFHGLYVSFYLSFDTKYTIGKISLPYFCGHNLDETKNRIESYQHFLHFVSDKLNELNNANNP